MMVESLWSKIKRRYLLDFNRPRLDLALHLILTNIVPGIRLTLSQLNGTWRPGRPNALADWQNAFKQEWTKLSLTENELIYQRIDQERATGKKKRKHVEIKWTNVEIPASWTTDIDMWQCSCPAFLFSRFLMCKHLVRQANSLLLNNPPLKDRSFWTTLRRHHVAPFYHLQGIHAQEPDPAALATFLRAHMPPSTHVMRTVCTASHADVIRAPRLQVNSGCLA
jgi:hypothetical protein